VTTITINGVEFTPDPNVDYGIDFIQWADDWEKVPEGETAEAWHRGQLRWLFENSLWALVFFVQKLPPEMALHPFCIQACREVQDGPLSATLDIWAREHLKSTIITCARTIQQILKNREITACIFSYTKAAALKFFNQVKHIFETEEILKWCYPDVLWKDPQQEAPHWSEDTGIFVKRDSHKKEATLYAAGLLDGMPTGDHYFLRIYDDIMVEDLADSPEQIEKLKKRFDLSANLGTDGGWEWIIGTPYTFEDVIQMLRARTKSDGTPAYHQRIKPATVDGEMYGAPVFQSEERLDRLRLNAKNFACQQCLNPMPKELRKLHAEALKEVEPDDIPDGLYKFMLVDPAGDDPKSKKGDCWSIGLLGVEPFREELGLSNVFIQKLIIEQMPIEQALKLIVEMYCESGRVQQLGVEKVALSTAEIHITNALRSRGRHLSVEAGNLFLLKPAGRSKIERIDGNLVWALNNGRVHISTAVPLATRERLKTEMRRYPVWHDDGIDMISYLYDMLKEYKFGVRPPSEKKRPEKLWLKKWRQQRGSRKITG
jgi:hypothetical protein